MNIQRVASSCLLLALFAASSASAQAPDLINYQGRLTDGTNLVNDTVGLTLRLYDAATLGTLLYEDSNSVDVVDGIYSTRLGDDTVAGSLPDALTNATVFIEVAVNGVALTPRERLASVAYALGANEAATARLALGVPANAITSAMIATGAVEWLHLAPSSVSSYNIVNGTITNADIAVNASISAGKIANTALVQTTTFDGDVSGGYNSLRLAANAVTGDKIADGTISNADVAANAAIAAGKIANTALVQNTAFGGDIAGPFNNLQLAAGSVSNAELSASAVTGNKIADGTISNADVAANAAIAAGKIANTALVQNTAFGGDIAGPFNNLQLAAGSVSNAELSANAVTGDKIANGTITAADVNEASFSNTFWKTDGNAGTFTATDFLGTTDNKPVEIRVNNRRALWIVPTNWAPNITVGANVISAGTVGASILGGSNNMVGSVSFYSTIGGGMNNSIGNESAGSSIGGGWDNVIGSNAEQSVIGGGSANRIEYTSGHSFIGGGSANSISTNSSSSVIAGGHNNEIERSSMNSVIGGGENNAIGQDAGGSTISGGRANNVGTDADYSFIPGGYGNTIENGARNSTALGSEATAAHGGVFVWADSAGGEFRSITNDEFAIRATNGVRIAGDLGSYRPLPGKGSRFGDNNIVAWGFIGATGNVYTSFNIASVANPSQGTYFITMYPALSGSALSAVAVAETESVPSSATAARIVSINSSASPTSLWVYICNGSFAPTNNDFTLMVTGR